MRVLVLCGWGDIKIVFGILNLPLFLFASKKEESEVDGTFVHQGLAQRSFQRVWTVSDDTEIGSVEFTDGLLTVELKKIVPEHHARKEYL